MAVKLKSTPVANTIKYEVSHSLTRYHAWASPVRNHCHYVILTEASSNDPTAKTGVYKGEITSHKHQSNTPSNPANCVTIHAHSIKGGVSSSEGSHGPVQTNSGTGGGGKK